MIKINIHHLHAQIAQFPIDKQDKYIVTYQTFINYLNSKTEVLNNSDIITAIGFAYSWMPRVLSLNFEKIDILVACLNQKIPNGNIDDEIIAAAIEVTNGSVVAASKLLHFILPTEFPIFDSHVYKYCWNKSAKVHHYQYAKIEIYLEYRSNLLELLKTPEAQILKKEVDKQLGYQVSPLRVLELSLFNVSRCNLKNSSRD